MRSKYVVYSAMLAGLTMAPGVASALPTCADLGTNPVWGLVGSPYLSGLTVALTPASGPNAAYCQINFTYSGESGPAAGYYTSGVGASEQIKVRVGLPLSAADGGTGGVQGAWNGKQEDLGGGGYAGSVGGVTGATNARYVGTSTDTGHSAALGGSFALNPDNTLNNGLIKDFARDGIHQQHDWGTRLAKLYYGSNPTRHYWNGCSTGGRQGHQQAQAFGLDYDGILAGSNAFNWDRFIPSELWPQIVMKDEVGGPITSAKLNAVNTASIAACDPIDGITDGIIQDPRACHYSATSFVCVANGGPSSDPNCLTPQEAVAVNKIWDGPRNAHGKKIWFGLERGTGLTSLAGGSPFSISTDHFKYWIKQDPTFDWHTITEASFVNDFVTSELKFGDIIGTSQPALTKFKNNGGKIITYHGLADPLIFPRGTDDYARRVAAYEGSFANAQNFYRYFRYPNAGHCGGAGINGTDLFNALVNWVENAVAPDSFVATVSTGRTRLICKFPDTQVYNGSGSTDDAANFHCQVNANDDPALVVQDILARYNHENE